MTSFSFVCPWNCGDLTNADRRMTAPPAASSARELVGLLRSHPLAIGAQSPGQGVADTAFMGAALGREDGIAVGRHVTFTVGRPRDGPFHAARIIRKGGAANEGPGVDGGTMAKKNLEVVGDSAREPEDGLCRRRAVDENGVARPANLDSPEQVGLGSRHPVEARRPEGGGAEDLRVGTKTHPRATPVGDPARLLEARHRLSAPVTLTPQCALPCDLDRQPVAERIDDTDTDAMEAAGRGVDVARELAARMQRREDDLEGRQRTVLRVGIGRYAPAVVLDGTCTVGGQLDIDAIGKARDSLVHGIVEDLGEEMVEAVLVRAADVHGRTPPDGIKTFEDLDIVCGIARSRSGRTVEEVIHRLNWTITRTSPCLQASAQLHMVERNTLVSKTVGNGPGSGMSTATPLPVLARSARVSVNRVRSRS